jgi:hypothetical protein
MECLEALMFSAADYAFLPFRRGFRAKAGASMS